MHDISLEQAVLGALLMKNDLLPTIAEKVTADAFFEPIHGQLFEICSSLIGMGKLANPLTIKTFLPKDMKIGEMNVSQYVARLAAEGCTASEVPHLAGVIRDMADRRAITSIGGQLVGTQADPTELAAWGVEGEAGGAASPRGGEGGGGDKGGARPGRYAMPKFYVPDFKRGLQHFCIRECARAPTRAAAAL